MAIAVCCLLDEGTETHEERETFDSRFGAFAVGKLDDRQGPTCTKITENPKCISSYNILSAPQVCSVVPGGQSDSIARPSAVPLTCITQ